MSEPTETSQRTCAICARTLLLGERSFEYANREGERLAVCQLCKPRANAAGWLRPDEALAQVPPRSGRRRRRGGGELLGGLLGGLARGREAEQQPRSPPERPAEGGDQSVPDAEFGPEPGESPTEPSDARRPAKPADVQAALAVFNAGDGPRTVAGLASSLGAPRATVVAIRNPAGASGARLTVAWELAWYQWEVRAGKRGAEVRRSAEGESTDQLREADRNWNLAIAGDGTLSRLRRGNE